MGLKSSVCVHNKEVVMAKEIAMEDVRDISLEVVKLVETKLKEFGIELKDGQDDEIYVPVNNALEKIAGYPDYRSYN
jgi:hypothetical protein